eukprot:TRINITY_DN7679_c0_g1_i1.p1 TRINITY_DN7679_c0_g1~~TRINITY_DN7679_c0_g1_i1.p1  ORF type:complete len:250 (+),score=58.45 TRINITY_DN7679_c0_g1_i1:209-958(+)
MGDYHFVYKDLEGTSTEWDDLQRKYGNLPPKPAVSKPSPWTPAETNPPKDKGFLDNKNEDELEDLEDDLADDRFLEEYRKKRLTELKESARKPRFGTVLPITGSDFVREVSQAPSDVWVVVHLYKDGVPECGLLGQCLDELATKYPATKFVKIISTECIPRYPDQNLPTILIYNNGNVKATYVGLHNFGGRRCTSEGVALTLCQTDPVLKDREDGNDAHNDAIRKKVQRGFIEKLVADRENADDSSDED